MQITPITTVKEVIESHPHLFSIFHEHGMCASCQDSPPPVPLSHFAMKHCNGDIDGLVEELKQHI